MEIRIAKGNGWYENKVGYKLEVIRTRTNSRLKVEYIVYESLIGYTWVDEDDCEIVKM